MQKIKTLLVFTLFSLLAFTSCKKADPCETTLCLNDSFCENGSCQCATGYEGTKCDTEVRSKFMGLWNVTSICTGEDPENNLITITSGDKIQDVVIYLNGLLLQCNVKGNNINIEPQDVGSIISGSGTIDENHICTINLIINDGANTYTCEWTMTK